MKKENKGFTLIELIIVIAILGIIALIAIPNLAGIRQRSQISADIRTAEQIGKAARIWITDIDAGDRTLPVMTAEDAEDGTTPLAATEAEQYDLTGTYIIGLTPEYISAGFRALSLDVTDGGLYFISSLPGGVNGANQKIAVGIVETAATELEKTVDADADPNEVSIVKDYDGTGPDWAYIEQ